MGYNAFSRTVSSAVEKVVLLQKKCDECRLTGYRVRYPVHPPDSTHCPFHDQQAHASWQCLFLSDYDEPFEVHVGKVVSGPDIDVDIPSTLRDNFHRKGHTRNAYSHTPL
jgi:hypothetical protein